MLQNVRVIRLMSKYVNILLHDNVSIILLFYVKEERESLYLGTTAIFLIDYI